MMTTKNAIEPSRRSPLLGTLLYHLVPVRRKVIADNITRALGDHISAAERLQLMKAFYTHMLKFGIETGCTPFTSVRRRKEKTTVDGYQHLEAALSQGKGALWLGCHLGNWEVGLTNFMKHAPHLKGKVSIIRKRLRPKILNDFVVERFRKAGIEVMAPEPASIKKILQKLRRNESIIFVHDQHTSMEAATRTEFFGRPVQSARSLARIALKTGAPVLPAITWRTPDGYHVSHFGETIPNILHDDPEEAIRLTTRAYNAALERYILQHPEQWFGWAHRLWKIPKKKQLPVVTPSRG